MSFSERGFRMRWNPLARQTVVRLILIVPLVLAFLACTRDGMRPQIHVAGVGDFKLEKVDSFHFYVSERPSDGVDPLLIVIYPERDVISDAYEDKIRRTVSKVVAGYRLMIARAEPQVRELMKDCGLQLPPDFAAFVNAQRLTHIKIELDGAEIICGTCDFFPNFDLNATLDADAEITKVWFDG